jgi:formylmethanofuran dehydrogenase subunit E
MPDNYSLWEDRERQQEAWLRKRPVCADCDEPIQADHYFDINGEAICPDCMEGNYRKDIGDYIE